MGRLVKSFGRVVPAAALDAHARVQTLVADAAQQASTLVADARVEADAIREAARRAGEDAGRAAAEDEYTTVLLRARQEAERIRSEAQPGARALAARMAEKIVGRAIASDPHVMAEIAAQALSAARARSGALTLRVHPDDLATLEAERPELAARLGKAVELRLLADVAVAPHGCVVESASGRLDARLATQLAALERAAFGMDSGSAPTGDRATRDA
jgi:type III secretion protein L